MSFLFNILKGLVIGTGFIIPGVSGGSIAVILRIYDKLFSSIKNIKNRDNFVFLLSIGIGVFLGVILFGNVLLILYRTKEMPTKYLFIGLVLGGIPSLIFSIREKNQERLKLIPIVIAIIISIILFLLEKYNLGLSIGNDLSTGAFPFFELFIAGLLYAVGKVVPGISGSALLILVGMYEYFLKIVANPFSLNINSLFGLIPFFLGIFIGVVFLFKLMNYLFNKHYITTYSVILGFVIGSLLYLYPGISFDLNGLICFIILSISTILSYMITN